MKLNRHAINLCIIPFLCILPMLSGVACSDQVAAETASSTVDDVGDCLAELPRNIRVAAPYVQEDLERLWMDISATIDVAAQNVGVEQPEHPLMRAQEAREKLISGASFNEVVASAVNQLTTEDLKSMPLSDLSVLNGILPFEIDLESCGETLAEVLNSLDIGQVSAILESETGYHLIQLIDREGGRARIGHVVFEVNPPAEVAGEPAPDTIAEEPGTLEDAISRLARALRDQ